MPTISCYAFHHLVLRFVKLWRYVQVVSDILTFVLSMLCCQCWNMMPMSPTASIDDDQSLEAYKIISEPVIDAGRASGEPFRPQHLVIDFTPQPQDEEVGLKCQQFWEVVNKHPEIEKIMVLPEGDRDVMLKEISASVPVHKHHIPPHHESNFPALKAIKKLTNNGTIDTAFVATTKPKY